MPNDFWKPGVHGPSKEERRRYKSIYSQLEVARERANVLEGENRGLNAILGEIMVALFGHPISEPKMILDRIKELERANNELREKYIDLVEEEKTKYDDACQFPGCIMSATHGPGDDPVSCWMHAGAFPRVKPNTEVPDDGPPDSCDYCNDTGHDEDDHPCVACVGPYVDQKEDDRRCTNCANVDIEHTQEPCFNCTGYPEYSQWLPVGHK